MASHNVLISVSISKLKKIAQKVVYFRPMKIFEPVPSNAKLKE